MCHPPNRCLRTRGPGCHLVYRLWVIDFFPRRPPRFCRMSLLILTFSKYHFQHVAVAKVMCSLFVFARLAMTYFWLLPFQLCFTIVSSMCTRLQVLLTIAVNFMFLRAFRQVLLVLPFSHSFHNHAQPLRLSQLPPHAAQTSKSTSLAGVMILCLTLPLARLSGLNA